MGSFVKNLKDSENFQHHFGASNALRPKVVKQDGDLSPEEEAEVPKTKSIPKDLWLPGLLVMICCFNKNLSYVSQFSTFAVFFKEYHGWNEAIWASFAQTAGDLLAAIMMKVLGAGVDGDEEVGYIWRLTRQPYSFLGLRCFGKFWISSKLEALGDILGCFVDLES